MPDSHPTERRKFSRIPFSAGAHLSGNGELHLNCHVIDISLRGVLISIPNGWKSKISDKFNIDLILQNAQIVIKMDASVAHIDKNTVGFLCEHIDLDSISHLKRLVELNLADEALLNRELSALIEG